MQYLAALVPLAALAVAGPLEQRGSPGSGDACVAAVTGSAALGDSSIRSSHCSSYLATTVTPPAITVTTTLTASSSAADAWKRSSVTVCPNEVPNYASVCDEAGYSSACSVWGITKETTTTLAPTTTTKTVYVKPTACVSGATTTVTVTVTKDGSGSRTTSSFTTSSGSKTTSSTGSGPTDKCLSDDDAKKITDNFITLLEFTSYNGTQGAPGRGYQYNVSAITLDPAFVDISDSINFMAGFPIGSITFANKTAFDYGQGVLQPEVAVTTLNVWHSCHTITWRWSLLPFTGALPVTGINFMEINDKGLIQKNYAEFDSGVWLQDFGRSCAINPPPAPVTPALKRSVLKRSVTRH